jgi:hypothetical protein
VLIPNAADPGSGDIAQITEINFDRAFGVDVKGPCFVVQVLF